MMALTLSSSVHFQDVIIQVFLQADRFWQCCLLQAWSEVPHILWHCRVLLPRSAAGYISNFLYFNSCLISRVLMSPPGMLLWGSWAGDVEFGSSFVHHYFRGEPLLWLSGMFGVLCVLKPLVRLRITLNDKGHDPGRIAPTPQWHFLKMLGAHPGLLSPHSLYHQLVIIIIMPKIRLELIDTADILSKS